MNVVVGIAQTFHALDPVAVPARLAAHARRIRPTPDCGVCEALMSDARSSSWCDRSFRRRRGGGREQRFCRPSCRQAFHAAARAWTHDAIASGSLTFADLLIQMAPRGLA